MPEEAASKNMIPRGMVKYAMLALLVFYFIAVTKLAAEESPLVMGVFPRKGFTQTITSFTPLAEHLSAVLGRKVVVESGRNFADFWQGVEQRRYDLETKDSCPQRTNGPLALGG